MRKMYSGETIIQNRKQGGKIYETHQETALCRCIHACRMHPRSRAITELTAQAATSTTANANWKKAPNLKKTGAYAVTARTDDTYIRFVAPTSGVYKFTISNLHAYKKSSKTSYGYASMLVQRPVKRSNVTKLSTQTVSTAGGRTSALHLSTQGMYTKPKKVTATDFLLTRSFSMRLTRGQSVYLRSKYVTPIKSKISQYNFTVTRTAK